MKQGKIIDKITKLLSLSKSDNANEAGAALQKARELMNEHGINETQIAIAQIKEMPSRGGNYKRPPEYIQFLAQTVSELFQCSFYWTTQSLPKWSYSRGHHVVYTTCPIFVGVEPNQEICAYTYDYLHRLLIKARSNYRVSHWDRSEKTRRRDSFAFGWVIGIHNQVRDLVPPKPTAMVDNGNGLIPIDPLEAYINDLCGEDNPMQSRETRLDGVSEHAGYEEGKEVQINRGVRNSDQLQLS